MRKIIVLLFLLIAQPIMAAEHVNGPATTLGTGWTGTGIPYTATNVVAKRADWIDPTIIKGHTYKFSVTMASYTAGMLTVSVGGQKYTSPSTPKNNPCGLRGECDIADNFTSANGLVTGTLQTINDSADAVGAFRFVAPVAKFLADDPVVFPGLPGAAHLHMFFCNTGVNANTTYKSLRTTGGTTCGDPRYPLNRSAYWTPAWITGNGAVAVPYYANFYYKRIPANNTACNSAPSTTSVGICTELPNGLKYVWGYTGPGTGIYSTNAIEQGTVQYQCRTAADENVRVTTGATGTYTDVPTMLTAGCPSGSVFYVLITAPDCWNGTQVDSANHRSHMANPDITLGTVQVPFSTLSGPTQYEANYRCPADHPYRIPDFSIQLYYHTDPSFFAGSWHLSSDEMVSPQLPAGSTGHMDYMEGWSPFVKDIWEVKCENEHRTCAQGNIGDGRRINTNGFASQFTTPFNAISLVRYGYSHPMMGNGTFTGEIKATASGMFSLSSYNGLSANITAFSLIDVTATKNKTPVTIHGTH